MRFGEFLYYNGLISWQTLITALVWQKRKRPTLGHIAVDNGLLSPTSVIYVLHNTLPFEIFGEAAIRLGLLSRQDVEFLIHKQKARGAPIGRYFIEQGLFSNQNLVKLLMAQARHNASTVKRMFKPTDFS